MNQLESDRVSKSVHWSQVSEAGALTGMRFLLGCYKLGGRPLFKLVLLPVITYFFLFRHDSRAASIAYLRRIIRSGALPETSSLYWLSASHFWSFGNALIDKLAVWMGQIPRAQVKIHNDELIIQQLASKQGAILIMSHLGNFEICRCLSARHGGMRLTVLMHTKHALKFNRLMKEHASDSQLDILQVTEITPATAMMLSERIERGEFIAIAGDRVAVNHPENALMVDFLGDKALLPIGPFTLAAILRAPLISLFCLRQGKGFDIYFEKLSDAIQVPRKTREVHLNKLAQTYANQLEGHCRRQPLQWFNFFDFWRLHDNPAADANDQSAPAAKSSPNQPKVQSS